MPGLGENIVANILATILIALAGWVLSIGLRLPFVFRKRRRLFGFLGIGQGRPSFTVYLSTVFVRPGGSVDFRGASRTFMGPAIPSAELSVVEPISRLFHEPVLDGLPNAVRRGLGERVHWSFQRIAPTFSASPQDRNRVEPGNILTIGSQYYNSAGDLYTETCSPILKMEQRGNSMIIRVQRGPRSGDTFEQRPGQMDDLAIVEKLKDTPTASTIFIAAGLGVVGTMGATQFIADNWEKLKQDFGNKQFAVCLRFQNVADDPQAFRKPVELSRFQD